LLKSGSKKLFHHKTNMAMSESLKCHNFLENRYYFISYRFCVYEFPNKSVQPFWGLRIGEDGVTHSRTHPLFKGRERGYG